jgi:transposase
VRGDEPAEHALRGRASVEQQDIQAVCRIRAELLGQRKAKGNQIRGLTAEYGLVALKELSQLRRALPSWLEDPDNGLSERFRRLLNELWKDLKGLDDRMAELDAESAAIAQEEPAAMRLQQHPSNAIALSSMRRRTSAGH